VTGAPSETIDGACLLDADIRFTRAGWGLDVALRVPPGGVLALLGPNGAGKTTTLQIMAGILPLHAGHVQIGGQCWDDASTGRRLPTQDRSLGLVFQDHLLFPRMSIRDNIAFGLRARDVNKTTAREQADGWLERVGLLDKAGRRPGQLSGGQAQLVALARALATDPQLLLLDEPLAALDAGTRMHVRSDLRRHLAGYAGATVLVTHDPLDALVLADHVVVIENGQVVQTGTPKQITQKPRTRYVAQLVGLNLLHGHATGTSVTLADGSKLTTAEHANGPVFVVVRPTSIAIHREHPSGSPRNVWPGTITGIEQHGDLVRLALTGPPDTVADVTPEAIGDLDLIVGAQVWLSVKATDLTIHTDA
jgi:molybdate transport system ATP-binding protein